MAATTKLIVWNEALRELGDHPLADPTTTSTSQKALADAWDHAVEYTLSRRDWSFARRRATLSSTASSAHPPFTRTYARPSDYLRKVWIKAAADDEFQIEHAEVAAAFYGFATSALIEYISDHADNYNPANWPPQFTRVMALYLAMLVAPKIGRVGADDAKTLYQKMDAALGEAERIESVTTINAQIPVERVSVLRRAIEILGQQVVGTVPAMSDADHLRWQMNKGWEAGVKFVLEQAPWNHATRRSVLSSFDAPTGVSIGSFSPYTFRFVKPAGFLKRLWIRETATDAFEAEYAEAGIWIYGFAGTMVMEYIAADADALNPEYWPASFAELVSLHLAGQVASAHRLVTEDAEGRKQRGASPREGILAEFARRLEAAASSEALQGHTKSIPANRLPVMRRAMEIMGQPLSGFMTTDEHVNRLRWQMNLAWDNAIEYVLAQGAWNFASKRAYLSSGDTGDENMPTTTLEGLGEGYSVEPPAVSAGEPPRIAGYEYSFPLPEDFVHKLWLKASVDHHDEIRHQIVGGYVFTSYDPAVMEYVANDRYTSDPENWPILFHDVVASYLAKTVAPELTVQVNGKRGAKVSANDVRNVLEATFLRMLSDAKNKDAIQQYPQEMPLGNLVRARLGGSRFGFGRGLL
jgi:hypothetical protein